MDRLFVDTSAWVAFVNRADDSHRPVAAAIEEWAGRLVTSNYVLDETVTLARFRLGHEAAVSLGTELLHPDAVHLVRVTPEDEAASMRLFRDRPDQRFSFTDCTSFILMRRLGIEAALSLDADFLREGFEVVP